MSTRTRRQTQAGVTLVELMVAVVVAGIVIAAVFEVMVTGTSLFSSQSAVAETQMAGRFGVAMVAQDLKNAGHGATPSCANDPDVKNDMASSCTPFADTDGHGPPAIQAIYYVPFDGDYSKLGAAGPYNQQFRPDELWIMTNPFPGQALLVTGLNGGEMTIQSQPGAVDDATATEIFQSWVLAIEQRGALSFRAGPQYPGSSATLGTDTSGDGGLTWTLTVSPPPVSGMATENIVRGYAGADAMVSAVRWIHYYLKPYDTGSTKVDLVREEWMSPNQDPSTLQPPMTVADDVVDFRVTFCRDSAFDPTQPPGAPTLECDLGRSRASDINARPDQLRTATITVRSRTKSEDARAYADLDRKEVWYDLDNNLNNGVARVRTVVRVVSLPSLARR